MRIPDGLWIKCDICAQIIYSKDLEKNLKICPKCGYHFLISSKEYIGILLEDADLNLNVVPNSKFESIIAGAGKLYKYPFVIASAYLDSATDVELLPAKLEDRFLKTLRIAASEGFPLLTLHPIAPLATLHTKQKLNKSAVKINALISEISKRGVLHLSILSHLNCSKSLFDFIPIGDIVISEPRADSQTLNSFERILVDLSISRKELKEVLENLLSFFAK